MTTTGPAPQPDTLVKRSRCDSLGHDVMPTLRRRGDTSVCHRCGRRSEDVPAWKRDYT